MIHVFPFFFLLLLFFKVTGQFNVLTGAAVCICEVLNMPLAPDDGFYCRHGLPPVFTVPPCAI